MIEHDEVDDMYGIMSFIFGLFWGVLISWIIWG
jgi:hypothetical protein